MIDLTILFGCPFLGAMVVWRTLVNANRMDRRTRHGIRLLNLALLLAGAGVFMGPFIGTEYTVLALQSALAAFVVCMFLGRRPTDRVLDG